MGLQVSNTSPGWPRPELPDPVFSPILAPIEHTGSPSVPPDEAVNGVPADLGTPGALPGYENSGDVIDTSSFTEADIDPTECEEPPYEPVYPPGDGEPPEYGDPPSDWNPPEEIPDNQEPIPEPIYITVKGDDATLCINDAGATIPSTQTVIPAQYANLFDPPTNGYNGNVGTYPVVPGEFHDPNDGNTYIVTSENGTLTVEYCDPDYDVICDCQLVAGGGYRDSEGRYYRTEANYIRYNFQSAIPTLLSPIGSWLAVAIKLQWRGQGEDPGSIKFFRISYRDEQNELREIYTSATSFDVTTNYLDYAVQNLTEADVNNCIEAYRTNTEWRISKPYKIVVEETDSQYNYRNTFERNYVNANCPLHTSGNYHICQHRWVTTNNPSILWAGTAQPGN